MNTEKKPKRILIFSLTYFPFVGGDGIALNEIVGSIDPTEMAFDMITLRFDSTLPRYEKIGNVNVHRIGFTKKNPTAEELVHFPMYLTKVLYPFMAFLKAMTLYKKHHYDCFWSLMSFSGFPIAFFRWFKKVPYLLTLQEGDPIPHIIGRWRIKLVMPILRSVFIGPKVTQVISKYLGDFSRQMGFAGHIEVVPNGVDASLFSTAMPRALEKRRELNIPDDATVLVTTSRLVGKNAINDVIRAMSILSRNTFFIVIGTGPDGVELKRLAEKEGVSDRVLFLGHLQHKELPLYLQMSDIFIRPSISEGFGNSFIEAMASRIPVIATRVGGIPDFLEHEKTGLFCNVRDPKSIAEQVRRLIDDKSLRDTIVINSSKMVAERYDWGLIASRMKKVLEKVVK